MGGTIPPFMQPDQQLDVFRLLRNMSGHLENVRDDERVLRFCLRATRDFFEATDGCLARLRHGDTRAEIVYDVPRASQWDRELLTSFLRAERPRVPYDHLIVPLWRRARWWGVLCLRRAQGEFERGEGRLLQFVAGHVSSILERTDQARIHDARARLDRKISEQLLPRDLFYQILHLLRTLTRYDLRSGERRSAVRRAADPRRDPETARRRKRAARCPARRGAPVRRRCAGAGRSRARDGDDRGARDDLTCGC
jgi:hypothetical protein